MRFIWKLTLLLNLLWPLVSFGQESNHLLQQRTLFQQAEYAHQQGQYRLAERLATKLTDYPLYPYLRYRQLQRRLWPSQEKKINAFIQDYQTTPLANKLQIKWLLALAQQKDWPLFLKNYQGSQTGSDHPILQCHALSAELQTNSKVQTELFADIAKMWIVPYSQPQACDPLFAHWIEHDGLNNEQVWQRIYHAADARQRQLMRYLTRFLPEAEQPLIASWLRLDNQPELLQQEITIDSPHPFQQKIISNAFKRLLQRDDKKALLLWPTLAERYALNKKHTSALHKEIALKLALRDRDEADDWLAEIDSDEVDPTIAAWRVRVALKQEDWQQVLSWIAAMPEELQQENTWRYWQARAYEQINQANQATLLYQQLASSHNYYGLLASEQLNRPYQLPPQEIPEDKIELDAIQQKPGIQRARELYALQRYGEARREWAMASRRMTRAELRLAAYLAQQWNWHDRAIITAGNANILADLSLQYPLANQQVFFKEAKRHQLDPIWTFAIARQESRFTQDARSPAGALGIMQVLPSTAKRLVQNSPYRYRNQFDLLSPRTNIYLGTAYLQKMMTRYQDNPILAIAAYNAGPNRVAKWLPDKPLAADIWIETLPYRETRHYLKQVLASTVIYEYNLGQAPSLGKRMQDVG